MRLMPTFVFSRLYGSENDPDRIVVRDFGRDHKASTEVQMHGLNHAACGKRNAGDDPRVTRDAVIQGRA